VVKAAVLHWNEIADEDERTLLPTAEDEAVLDRNYSNSPGNSAPRDVPARFRTARIRALQSRKYDVLCILGADIETIFHMKQHHLDRWGVKHFKSRPSPPYLLRTYYLHQVYDAAPRTPGRPLNGTPEEALETYIAKVEKRCL